MFRLSHFVCLLRFLRRVPVSTGTRPFRSTTALGLAMASVTAAWATTAPTPGISPATGTYTKVLSVTIGSSLSGATIYYTTDGTTPTTSSAVYSGAITVSSSSTVKAMAVASGYTNSAVASASYTINLPAATPTFSPASSKYYSVQSVSIADATAGAKIYYTTNGTTPTTSSTLYSGPITVSTTQTIEAVAIASGTSISAVGKAGYTIQLPAATPVLSPAPGTYKSAQSLTITDSTPGTTIYYTINGKYPNSTSTIYSGPITLASNSVVQAIAVSTGYSTSGISGTYSISAPAAAPTFSPSPSKYYSVQSVTLSDSTSGATIYYTTNGTTPTTSSTIYTGPITVASTQTIEAVAIAPGGTLSPVSKGGYTIQLPTAVPVISPAAGTYNTVQTVTITDSTPGAVIYYSVNGKYPNTSSLVYSGPITATGNTLIQAVALAPSYSASSGASAQYSIVTPPPAITPDAGTFDYNATVSMADSATGAVIYYTMDGSTPTTASRVYSGPITLTPNKTTTTKFNAIAVAPESLQSSMTSGQVTVTLPYGVIASATVNTTPQMPIPPNFMGLSTDWTQPTAMMGQASTGANTAYYQLLNNLTQYLTAPMLIRVEGDNTTASQLQPQIEPLVELAQHVNVHYTLGVDLMNDNVATAEAEAAQWVSGIPNNLIEAIEVGNEPDNYAWAGVRSSDYAFAQYLPEFQTWQQGIQSTVGTGFKFMATSTASSTWDPAAEVALSSQTFTPGLISQHGYLAGGSALPADYLLLPTSVTKLPLGYAPYAAAAHQAGNLFRMGEINSIGGGGSAGISNSFQSALWSIDIMFNYLADGMDGVNWHSGQYTSYALFQFKPQPVNGKTVFYLTQVNPLYYGLWAFAQVAGRGAQLLPTQTMTDANVSIWSTVDNTNTAHVVVINKDETATGNVQITLPGYTTGTVRLLTAPSYTSTSGVSFGGLTFDRSADGNPLGTPTSTTISGQNGVFTLPSLPITTAAVIDFN